MSFIYNANTAVKVNRIGNVVQAECSLLSNDIEAFAWVFADVFSLQVQQAKVAIYRAPDRALGIFELSSLLGVEAYLNSGPALKNLLGAPGQELEHDLVTECIRGIIQAETFFYEERGYITAEKYVEYWHQNYAGLCRYYNNFIEIDKVWPAWLAGTKREYNLFNRDKIITIQRRQLGLNITCSFIDSFHHILLEICLGQNGQITSTHGNFINTPHDNCHENTMHLQNLTGHKLSAMSKREIAAIVGGPDGCTHLLEMVGDAVKAVAALPPPDNIKR